jgi:hypothetical protein
MRAYRSLRGFTLIEAVVVSAVVLIFLVGLIGMTIYVFDLITNARAKLSALAAVSERMEFIRSLPYNSVGTVAGIPSGAIPQQRTVTLNAYTFNERVLIQYVDDPADGVGPADRNGILSDYKQVKIEYSWNVTGATSSAALIATIVPRSMETTAGGGTIRVNVFNAAAAPVAGASVRLLNTSGTTTIDVTRFTNTAGVALFVGAPAGSNYQLFATKVGYSTDQTHVASASNPNPSVPPISVLEADISTMNFQIDRLADLSLRVYTSVTEASAIETFTDLGGLASSTKVAAVGGDLTLAGSGGVYETAGTAFLTQTSPLPLERWEVFSWARTLPPNTEALVRFYTGTSTFTLIPDSALPGNAAGFAGRLIDLRQLSVAAYPALTVGFELRTANVAVTPRVSEAALYYRQASSVHSGGSFNLHGAKVIGADGGGQPIYKFNLSETLDAGGVRNFGQIEWDVYRLSFPNLALRNVCPAHPIVLNPAANLTVEALATSATSDHLRVAVAGPDGRPAPGAAVELSRSGFSETRQTDACGQTFFNNLSANNDYALSITAPGFAPHNLSTQTVSGPTTISVTLSEL